MFPNISYLSDLLPHIAGSETIRVRDEGDHTVVVYMIQDEDTFNSDQARECRGITFHKDGKIAARTLHKFHNVGEVEFTRPENLQWADVSRIMLKRDGSMVTPVLFPDGSYKFKTKKKFGTNEALAAQPLGDAHRDWILSVLNRGLTPTFEFTSPRFPIVVLYSKDELTLLHVRENVSGKYLTQEQLEALNSPFPIVENVKEQFVGKGVPAGQVSWDLLKKAAEQETGIEGWVIQFASGQMVKLKTVWYNNLHHAVTFVRWRDIAKNVCADSADDLRGAFVLTGRDVECINKVEKVIHAEISNLKHEIAEVLKKFEGASMKDIALSIKGHQHFGLIMAIARGKEIDFLDWYLSNRIQEWSLEVVADSVAEE